MVKLERAFVYALDVPAVKDGVLEGGEARYGCCQHTEEQGHAETCVPETRMHHIERALKRTGIRFVRVTHRDEVLVRTARAEVSDEERQWLAEFLNHAPHIDPHDDEEEIVLMLAPFAALLRICVEERDHRASMDKQPGDEEEPQAQLPVEALIESNDAMRVFLRPVAGVALTDSMLEEMRGLLEASKIKRASLGTQSGDMPTAEDYEPFVGRAPEGMRSGPDGDMGTKPDPAVRTIVVGDRLVAEPTVIDELRAAQASIEHALRRLGGGQ